MSGDHVTAILNSLRPGAHESPVYLPGIFRTTEQLQMVGARKHSSRHGPDLSLGLCGGCRNPLCGILMRAWRLGARCSGIWPAFQTPSSSRYQLSNLTYFQHPKLNPKPTPFTDECRVKVSATTTALHESVRLFTVFPLLRHLKSGRHLAQAGGSSRSYKTYEPTA